jgi:hypothetical protein
MNKEEAHRLLLQELEIFRRKSFKELSSLVGTPIHIERKAPGGIEYQIEIEVFWDDPRIPGGNLRVVASIDDGGLLSSFRPITHDFIKTPSNAFLGE